MKIRHRRNAMSEVTPEIYMYSRGESPRIHSTSGVPTLEQLTQDVHLDPKDRSRARWLYEMGLKQYNHYMNNRDGVVTESIRVMNELRSRMTHAEVSLADEIGVALASKKKGELRKARVQYEKIGA